METPNIDQRRKGLIACKECCRVEEPKYQYEKNNHGEFMYSHDTITLCDECMAKGWTSDPNEIIDAFNKDSGFSIGTESPYKNNLL